MTPLAHYIAKQQLLPIGERECLAGSARFSDWHCFDCSPVVDMAAILVKKMVEDMKNGRDVVSGTLSFLPAESTWIEWRHTEWSWREKQKVVCGKPKTHDPKNRDGYLLVDRGDQYADVSHLWEDGRELLPLFTLPIAKNHNDDVVLHDFTPGEGNPDGLGIPGYGYVADEPNAWDESRIGWRSGIWNTTYDAFLLYACLAMINTPNVVGRRVNRAHVGLQKRLAAQPGAAHVGALRPWTEIILDVTEPPDSAGAGAGAAQRMSGRKALHFCRSHLRIQNGRLTKVRAHWRGDAALGIVQSRYKVA